VTHECDGQIDGQTDITIAYGALRYVARPNGWLLYGWWRLRCLLESAGVLYSLYPGASDVHVVTSLGLLRSSNGNW